MKSKKIRNALLVVLSLALVSATTVAITWAAATQDKLKDPKTNTFTNDPKISVKLREPLFDGITDWNTTRTGSSNVPAKAATISDDTSTANAFDFPDTVTKGADLGYYLADGYSPGATIPKNPMLKNTSSEDVEEWVAIKVKYTLKLKGDVYEAAAGNTGNGLTSGSPITLTKNTTMSTTGDTTYDIVFEDYDDFKNAIASVYTDASHEFNNASKWVDISGGKETIWMYTTKLAQNGVTDPLFNSVKIRTNADGLKPFYVTVPTAADNQYYPVTVKGKNGTTDVNTTVYISNPPQFQIDLSGYAIQGEHVTYNSNNLTEAGTAPVLLNAFIAKS